MMASILHSATTIIILTLLRTSLSSGGATLARRLPDKNINDFDLFTSPTSLMDNSSHTSGLNASSSSGSRSGSGSSSGSGDRFPRGKGISKKCIKGMSAKCGKKSKKFKRPKSAKSGKSKKKEEKMEPTTRPKESTATQSPAPSSGCIGGSCVVPSPQYTPNLPTAAPGKSPPTFGSVANATSGGTMTEPSTGAPTDGTESPIVGGDSVALAPFTIGYTYTAAKIPQLADIVDVSNLTNVYIRDYMLFRVDSMRDIVTNYINAEFSLLDPYLINYTSTAIFGPEAEAKPTDAELSIILSQAFLGDQKKSYLKKLKEGLVVKDNPFASTESIITSYETQRPKDDVTSRSKAALAAATGTCAIAFLAALAGIVMYRKKKSGDTKGKAIPVAGHATVGGDTYEGLSTVFPSSEVDNCTIRSSQFGESHSLTCQSDWAHSIHDATEDGSASEGSQSREPIEMEEPPLMPIPSNFHQFMEEPGMMQIPRNIPKVNEEPTIIPIPRHIHDIMEEGEDSSVESGAESEDEQVPMRVVDLIKRFSKSGGQ